MAETAKETVILIDQHEAARRAAEERARAEAAGELPKLDVTKPGGVYRAQDGRFHDAHGREVSEDGALVDSEHAYTIPPAATAQVGGPDVTDAVRDGTDAAGDEAWRADMREQRKESIANPVEGAPIFGDTILPPLEDDEVEEVDESTGAKRKVKKSARRRK